MRRLLPFLLTLIFTACRVSADPGPQPAVPTGIPATTTNPVDVTRPASVRTSEAPLIQGTPGQYTVTIRGWAVDSVTSEQIKGANFLIVTVLGTYTFDDTFEVSIPADTVLQILVKAAGYADNSVQLKPHYRRNVQLEMQIPMSRPTPTPRIKGLHVQCRAST